MTFSVVLNCRSPISSPYEIRFAGSPATATIPSVTVNCAAGTPNRAAARSSSTRRASAAAWRSGFAPLRMPSLAVEAPWLTVRAESPMTIVTRSNGTSSSSAMI